MNKQLAITLVELNNSEAPNIGTIVSSIGDEQELVKKATEAIESHFDAELKKVTIQDGLGFSDVRHSHPLDAVVELQADALQETYKIEIQQTWIY